MKRLSAPYITSIVVCIIIMGVVAWYWLGNISKSSQPPPVDYMAPIIAPLLAPENLMIQPKEQALTVQWQEDASAESYHLFWSMTPFQEGLATHHEQGSQPKFALSGLTNGALYYLQAANRDGDGGWQYSELWRSSPIYQFSDGGNGQITPTGAASDAQDMDFSFTKIAANGAAMSDDVALWNCVLDNTTGLVWERKVGGNYIVGDEGLHDVDDRFTWFDSNASANPDVTGVPAESSNFCFGYDASDTATFCNTEAYVKRVNKAALCGFNDWRMPTVDELMGLVDYGRMWPAINTDYFPGTRYARFYWTDTHASDCSYSAWYVYFLNGCSELGYHTDHMSIRLVRSASP